jgi:hypothetical protein
MKHLPLLLALLLATAGPALAEEARAPLKAGQYSCRAFEADTAAPTQAGYAAASEYALVFLHVGLEAGGLPHHPITAEREAAIMREIRALCRKEAAANFRLIMVRYIQSAAFRDWWSKLSA